MTTGPAKKVLTKDGRKGSIEPSKEPSTGRQQQVLVRLDDGMQVWVPIEALRLQEDGSYFLPFNLDELESWSKTQEPGVIPVIEEELQVGKRQVETGVVRVTKRVQERDEVVDDPGFREEVQVERVPVNQVLDEPASVRTEGDTLVIPIMEEVLVIEKRLMLKEEVRVTKRRYEVREPKEVTLRSEEAIVERLTGKPAEKGASDKG